MNSLILASLLALHWGLPHGPSNLSTANGTVMAIDTTESTITVRLPNSWDDIIRYSPKTTLYGAAGLIAAGPQSLKMGSQVIVHYSIHGDSLDLAALEIDQIGDGGMKGVPGTIQSLDRMARKLELKGTDGSVHTFTLTDWAAMDGSTDRKVDLKKEKSNTEAKSSRVTVYFAQEAGAKVAHYFDHLMEEE